MEHDELTGQLTDERCPQCGSALLANKRGDKWCSNAGGISVSGCQYGLYPLMRAAYAQKMERRLVDGEPSGRPIGIMSTMVGDMIKRKWILELDEPTTHEIEYVTGMTSGDAT